MKEIKWWPSAQEDLDYWKKQDLKKYDRIIQLCESIKINPKKGLGKPEPLKHELTGFWSRRIDEKHMVIYKFDDKTIDIIQARYHYSKK